MTSTGRTGTLNYNVPTSVVTSGQDTNGSSLFSGTITATVNNDNSCTTNFTASPTYSGAPSSIKVSFTMPSTWSETINWPDSLGGVHALTTTTSGSTTTITDTFTLNGHPWKIPVSSPDGNSMTISWVTATGSHSFSMTRPALANSSLRRTVASIETMHNDFDRFNDGVEVAKMDCDGLARQIRIAFNISGISFGLGWLLGLPA